MVDFPPHVTIVHPRTSGLREQAWRQLASIRMDIQFTITHVAITAFSGDRWQTLSRLPLCAVSTGQGRGEAVPRPALMEEVQTGAPHRMMQAPPAPDDAAILWTTRETIRQAVADHKREETPC